MKKKVGIITLHLGFGGVELASINLANMLVGEYDVTIINTYKSDIAFEINENVKVVTLCDFISNRDELKKAIKSKNPTKIFKELFMSFKILYLRTNLVKKHLKNNDYDILISSRYLYTKLINKMKLDSVKIAIEHRHHKWDEKYINNLIKACKNIDYLIPVSKELTDYYSKLVDCKCLHIPNCIEYYPKKINLKKDKQIISVGRLSPEKGFDDLIKIFTKICKKHKDWKLVIAGDGTEKLKLENLIENSGCKDNIELLGFIEKPRLRKYYDKSAIYVMTSHEEAFPLVIMEAQSFGIPCVTYSTAFGALEMIDNSNGFVIEGRNEKEMVNKINKLINDNILREKLSIKSREDSKKYTFDIIKKRWLKTLKNSLKEK